MAANYSHLSELQNSCNTLVELLRKRAIHQSEQVAYIFLEDGETETHRLTYGELDKLAIAIAIQLQALGLSGERALLLYPPGLDYLAAFFGCLYAGAIAVPAYPPSNKRNTPRIEAIAKDAQAAIALTTSTTLPKIQSLLQPETNLNNLKWLTTDNLTAAESSWQEPKINRENLAFLQYTSGSTGTPKGVMLSHGNLLHNAAMTYRVMEHSPESKFVTWLPTYHDMGLIGGVLQPLYGGFPCIMMPPATFLQSPYRWLKAISNYRGTTSGAPNFAYELCVQKITPEQLQTLDLSSWNVAFNGAEPIRWETLERFSEIFATCGFRPESFYPCYGMAEASLMVSGSVKAAPPVIRKIRGSSLENKQAIAAIEEDKYEDIRPLVGCGKSMPEQEIVIVNPETLTRCLPDEVGEIWVYGPSVGQGYWNRKEETEEIFRASLADSNGYFLRTGDLGFLQNGELFVTGRAKDLIIIRGRNLYPQDIEFTAESSHPALRKSGCAAFSVEVEKEERLVIVQELEFRQKPNYQEVIAAIRQALAQEHEVQAYAVVLIKPGSILKTSSGKIQRRAMKALFLEDKLEAIASSILETADFVEDEKFLRREELLAQPAELRQSLLESYLQERVARVLKISASLINIQQPVSSLGLDSLKVFELKNRLEVDLEVAVSVTDLFADLNLGQLATQILEQLTTTEAISSSQLTLIPKDTNEYSLSFAQQRLWFINHLAAQSPAYNIPVEVRVLGKLNITALEKSLNEIIHRHWVLRTSFVSVKEEPVQVINSEQQFTLEIEDLRELSGEEKIAQAQQKAIEEAAQPFDLSQPSLLRAKLLQLAEEEYKLLLSLHHIVADGWSIGILIREITTLYEAFSQGKSSPLPELPIQYVDYSSWQRQWLKEERINSLLAYWKQQLSGKLLVLDLPCDRPRTPITSFRGDRTSLILSKSLTTALKKLSQQEGATLFMTLLAAFKTLLYRYTGQTDILIGSPIANRNRAEIDPLIGFFVNLLVLRSDLSGEPSFKELLAKVRKVALDAYVHQDLPFEKLVEELQPERDLSYNPLIQVMFSFQNFPMPKTEGNNLSLQVVEGYNKTAKFDLTLFVEEREQELVATFEYNADLFNADTIERMLGHFSTLLEGVVANPDGSLEKLPLLTEAERHQLIFEWNQTKTNYPQNQCIHELFEAQVEKTPNAIALVFENQQLTYRELNNRANSLAHYLQKLGVRSEVLVGICVERSLEMVIGILGILKAGGAYVPIDPTYPKERLAFMLEDAAVPVLLTQARLVKELPQHQARVVCLDTDWKTIDAQMSQENPTSGVTGENLVYTIYTSGSTGKPKGAMNTHLGLCNRLLWMQDAYQLTATDSVLQKTPFSFDVSVWEFFWPLIVGARLVLAKPGGHFDSSYLVRLIAKEKISTLHFVPSMLQVFLEEPELKLCNCLKRVICSGEALPFELQEKFFARLDAELYNLYGPTEASIDVTFWRCTRDSKRQIVPIGYPIANTQIYILDRQQKPVPIGVPGELHIGGVGLGRGYLNRPDLTNQKFIPHPFSNVPGARLYKTGDLARYQPDGSIEFLGRIDHQVKIRGFRIELGEIETVLAKYPGVLEVVVLAREDEPGNKRLVAYVVSAQGAFLDISNLRDYLKKQLPEYMVPSAFMLLDALPLLPNGKVDRRALPVPESLRPIAAVYEAPKSEMERAIAQVWQAALKLEKVGVNDNFFDLGGHSLLMVLVTKKLNEVLERNFSVVELFQHPTINSLAQYLADKTEEKSHFDSLSARVSKQREILARQRQLSLKQRKNTMIGGNDGNENC